MTGSTLIIGYGSDLRGDDALGPTAAALLESRVEGRDVRILSRTSLTPELAIDVTLSGRVIFIDCDAALRAGQIERREVAASPDADAMVHFLDPPALLGWSKQLFGVAPPAVLFAMGGETFECADTLSPTVSRKMPVLIDSIMAELGAEAVH